MKIILEADDFTKEASLDTVPAELGWCFVDERLEVNVNGVDVWDLLMPSTQEGLEDSFKSDFEPVIDNSAFDDIDVPTYRELNEI